MTELRVFGRSGSDGAAASPAVVGALAVIVDGKEVLVGVAAGSVSVWRASVEDGFVVLAAPARSHGFGGETVLIVDLSLLEGSATIVEVRDRSAARRR